MKMSLATAADTDEFGQRIGRLLYGGETIELVGDIGAGKTALTKAIARGMGITEDVQSPTFTISRTYEVPSSDVRLAHYDFYRLQDAGILSDELREAAQDESAVVVVEWAGIVDGVLPLDRLTVQLQTTNDDGRTALISSGGAKSQSLLERLAG